MVLSLEYKNKKNCACTWTNVVAKPKNAQKSNPILDMSTFSFLLASCRILHNAFQATTYQSNRNFSDPQKTFRQMSIT